MGCARVLRKKTMRSDKEKKLSGSQTSSPRWQQLSLFEPPSKLEISRLEARQGSAASTGQLKKLGVWLLNASEQCHKMRSRPRASDFLAQGFTKKSMTVAVNDIGRAIGEDHWAALYTDADVERAREFRQQGYTLRQISKMLDMPVRTVRGYLDGSRRNQSISGWKVVKRWRKS